MPSLNFVTVTDGWPSIDIGRMIHQIVIEQYGFASPPVMDTAGPKQTWSTFLDNVPAAIEPVSGRDKIRGGMTTTELDLTIATWFIPGVKSKMRVLNKTTGSRYVIQSVENMLERNVVMILNCLALADQSS